MDYEVILEHAKKQFEAYLSEFDQSDPKILLKKTHTYETVKVCEYLAKELGLSAEDRMLALLIGLLHDVGRFTQLRMFNSYDDRNLDHAKAGVQCLFEQGRIRDYIDTDQYDEIIRKAILYHSVFRIEDVSMSERERLHAQIIRDADKLDNFRVKLEEPMEAILGKSEDEVGMETISDGVYETMLSHKTILRNERITNMDVWVSFQAFVFGLYFPESHRYLQKHDLIRKNIHRIPYGNPDTSRRMEVIEKELLDYNDSRAE